MDACFTEKYKIIGSSLKKRRLEMNLTQSQLADLAGKMDRSKISDIENGKEDFLFSTLLKLCKALGVSVHDILVK
ncbi:helix-turn-helix transcriptional regulator [Chryseobacterium sp. NKUCC03_KSP]|uniref:helix-turn-helix transcriptional regulator n=1 Tax=Chryseobacterium sp. NKUCC03_KSP TaxID=2842125 RepID=UPI001C5A711F|nr:helix-turn-helix transcriptional regulator [Chryseobacterium sp. NKUCC03_KSP]MBW3524331.1 helix-turn-helix domain-containing protein [Chryseobacterium sp. NKUCC03_KSP]